MTCDMCWFIAAPFASSRSVLSCSATPEPKRHIVHNHIEMSHKYTAGSTSISNIKRTCTCCCRCMFSSSIPNVIVVAVAAAWGDAYKAENLAGSAKDTPRHVIIYMHLGCRDAPAEQAGGRRSAES